MTIKVIATDMDGTFLDDKGSYDKERFSQILDAMDARDMHFVVASGNSMSRLKPMFAETFDRLHFVAENGGQVVSYGKLLCQEFMASNDVENLLSYFNYDLLDRPTIFNGAQGSYMLKGSRVNFAEMITEEEQAAMEASIQRLNGLEELDDDFVKITMLLSPEEADRVSQAFNRDFDGNLVAVLLTSFKKACTRLGGSSNFLTTGACLSPMSWPLVMETMILSSCKWLVALMLWKMPVQLFYKRLIRLLPTTKTKEY